jgi:putative membrane protein
MRVLLVLAASTALAACNTTTNDNMAPPAGTAAAAIDPNSPLFHPTYMATSASSDQFEIQSSQLALQASHSQAVRSFANLMIAHHQATTQNLVAAAQSAGLTPPSPALLPMHQQMLDQLRAAGTGANFDAAYKQSQITSHQAALELQTNYAGNGDVPALRQVAAATAPVVQQHLGAAQNLNIAPMNMEQPAPASGASRSGERG